MTLPPGRRPKHGADKLVAAVGLDTQVKWSGRWQRQVRIGERGSRHVRRGLMLAAHNAARSDAQCKALGAPLRARGKHHTVVLGHVAQGRLHIAYGVLLHERSYVLAERFTTTPKVAVVGT